ncbi:uncharacterized protein LOC144162855 isoform X2 [Haemaphysalis longicornis]
MATYLCKAAGKIQGCLDCGAPSSHQGRLEGLELGVPAACFGQRFCAWGAPCADVSDREHRSCLR